jgi:hypothetical protein
MRDKAPPGSAPSTQGWGIALCARADAGRSTATPKIVANAIVLIIGFIMNFIIGSPLNLRRCSQRLDRLEVRHAGVRGLSRRAV